MGEEIDYKTLATEAVNLLRGLMNCVYKDKRISTTYVDKAKFNDKKLSSTAFGDYRRESAQFLFNNAGIFWKDALYLLTDEQQEKIKQVMDKSV